MKYFNASLIFTPAVFILCKRVCGPRRSGAEAMKYDVPGNIVTNSLLHNFNEKLFWCLSKHFSGT